MNEHTQIIGRVDTCSYDSTDLPANWDELSDSEQIAALEDCEPVATQTDYNTTVEGMHTYFARDLNPNDSISADVTHLAVGDDDSVTPASTDASLNNEVFRKGVSTYTQVDNTIEASTVIDTGEANGNTFKEVGLFAGPNLGDRMWNHSIIASVQKDSSRTITLDITLTFTTA